MIILLRVNTFQKSLLPFYDEINHIPLEAFKVAESDSGMVVDNLLSSSLFFDKRLILISGNFNSEFEDILIKNWQELSSSTNIILLHPKPVLKSQSELNKLIKDSKCLELSDVVSDDKSIFQFLDAFYSRKLEHTLLQLRLLFDKNYDYVQLLTMLIWQWKKVWEAQATPPNVHTYPQKKAMLIYKTWGLVDLIELGDSLMEMEYHLKRDGFQGASLITNLIYEKLK